MAAVITIAPGLGYAVPVEPVRAWIQEELAQGGRTQAEFAEDARMSREALMKIPEPGARTWVRLNVADRIAIATGHWLGELDDAA